MNFRKRVDALKAACPTMRRCRACGGMGIGAVVVVRDPADRGHPRGCARCGKVGVVKRIVLLPMEAAA